MERLAELAGDQTDNNIYTKLTPRSTRTIDGDFVALVWRYLRDECNAETYLTTFFNELQRRSGRGFVPEEHVELDHTWFVPLTNSGAAPSKPAAIIRAWSAIAWITHHRERGHLNEMLRASVPGEYPAVLPRTYQDRIDACIEDLLTVTSMPDGQGHLAAAALIGRMGSLAIPGIKRHLEHSPAGWRTMRAATQALLYARDEKDHEVRSQIEHRVFDLLVETHQLNYPAAYRARSFWEECADALPRPRDVTHDPIYDTIVDFLIERATTSDENQQRGRSDERVTPSACPVRERMTAAVVAFERIRDWDRFNKDGFQTPKWSVVDDLIEPLRAAAQPSEGRAFEGGLDYTAAFLEHLLLDEHDTIYPGPHDLDQNGFWNDRPEVRFVDGLLTPGEDGQPTPIDRALEPVDEANRLATRHLIGAATLAVSGIVRRRLLETLVTAGLGKPAADAFTHLANEAIKVPREAECDLRFVVETSVFNLGYMGSVSAIRPLMDFAFGEGRRHAGRAVRMTALMAIGDLAHLIRNGPQYDALRGELVTEILARGWADPKAGEDEIYSLPELRGALHVLTMLRTPDDRIDKFLRAVQGQGAAKVYYRDRAHQPTWGVDERSAQLAAWCEARTIRRREAIAAAAPDLIPSWLISPIGHWPKPATATAARETDKATPKKRSTQASGSGEDRYRNER